MKRKSPLAKLLRVRRLQEGFQEYVGATPSACLRDIRLARAHEDLMAASTSTVAEVAARWNFTNTGRFAAAYRDKYGCAPSTTLPDAGSTVAWHSAQVTPTRTRPRS